MNFTQMHERLRQELLRRLQRDAVSVSLLARQTGLAQAHISNFLRGRRRLSLDALDRVLQAQHMSLPDLLSSAPRTLLLPADAERTLIPLLASPTALFEPILRPAAFTALYPVSTQLLGRLRPRCIPARYRWERFVAVRLPASESLPMEPFLLPESTLLIDRHYSSLLPYRPGGRNLYAIRLGSRLCIRFADFQANRLVLRPYNPTFPVELIELDLDESPAGRIAGRVAMIANEP